MLHKGRDMNDQHAHEKTLLIISQQENGNENYDEILWHPLEGLKWQTEISANMEELEISSTAAKNTKMAKPFGKLLDSFLKS